MLVETGKICRIKATPVYRGSDSTVLDNKPVQ